MGECDKFKWNTPSLNVNKYMTNISQYLAPVVVVVVVAVVCEKKNWRNFKKMRKKQMHTI